MRSAERREVNVIDIKCLKSFVGVSRKERVRNEEVCRRAPIGRKLASGVHQRVLRWFGHMEKLDDREYRRARRVLTVVPCGGRGSVGWMM